MTESLLLIISIDNDNDNDKSTKIRKIELPLL